MFYMESKYYFSTLFWTLKVRAKHDELQTSYSETKAQLEKVQEYSAKLDTEMAKLEEVETEENQGYFFIYYVTIDLYLAKKLKLADFHVWASIEGNYVIILNIYWVLLILVTAYF